ncbi:MAG: zinc ABC transporter substrate-binding protein [Pontibacterium sp.]
MNTSPSFLLRTAWAATASASVLMASNTLANASQPTSLVVSIEPLRLIVQEVVPQGMEVHTLVPAGGSPHTYSLKPSDLRKLDEAQAVVWLGPELEAFLAKVVSRHPEKSLELVHVDKDHDEHRDEHESHDGHDDHHDEHESHDGHDDHHDEHESHEGHDAHHDEHESHDEHDEHHDEHEEHAGHDDNHHHDHGGVDPHIWLDPLAALEVAEKVAQKLTAAQPASAAEVNANLANFRQNIIALDSTIKAKLAPHKDAGFYVFHDAWGHFVNHYGLNQKGYFTLSPEVPPGARKLIEVREQLSNGVSCLFTEPQFSPKVVNAVARGTGVNVVTVDPLASQGGQTYIGFMEDTAARFASCLDNS